MKYTTEIFKEKATLKYSDIYNYSLVNYIDSKTKVDIICPKHGKFSIPPNKHLYNRGCPKCGRENSHKYKRKDSYVVIINFKKIHRDVYDYSLVEYINRFTKIKIICKKHGIFEQTPDNHLKGKGCPICGHKIGGLKRRITLKEFIDRAQQIHGDKYNYSNVCYNKINTKIEINCIKHGKFYQTPHNHLNGRGCPKCSESRGEKEVRLFLEKNNIKYQREKKFKNCKNKYLLPFDFYLPDKNILIEYDGMQHFRVNEYFGGEIGFKATQKNDKIKNTYANEKNIKLLRISYWENIEKKLFNKLL